jgi:hypothetical protein
MADAVKHALADVDAVRTGMRRDGVSDREFLNALELMDSLHRQVDGTVSVLMAAAEARHAAERATNTPLEVMLTTSGQESVAVGPKPGLPGRDPLDEAERPRRGGRWEDHAEPGPSDPGCGGEPPPVAGRGQKDRGEQLLLTAAERLPADKLRAMTDTVLDQVAPEAKDTPEQRQVKLDLRDARATSRRCLRFGVPADGSIDFHGSLPPRNIWPGRAGLMS